MIPFRSRRFTVLTEYTTTQLTAENETLSLIELYTSCRQFQSSNFTTHIRCKNLSKSQRTLTKKTKESLINNQILARA